jgi:hypothetical protein
MAGRMRGSMVSQAVKKKKAQGEGEQFTATTGIDDPRTPFGKEESYVGDGADSDL